MQKILPNWMHRERLGNCLLGAIFLAVVLKAKISFHRRRKKNFPHFYAYTAHQKFHFKRTRDLLPFPFNLFLFLGKYCEITKPLHTNN